MRHITHRTRYFFGDFLFLMFVLSLVVVSQSAMASAFEPSRVWQAIQQQGEIRIGVKTDFSPFGMLDSTGQPVGMEIDLARYMAEALGVDARIISVTTENRFQRLEQGAVDLIIATAGDTRERRLLATAIEPSYYGAGVNVMLRPDAVADEWADVRGQRLCALQGAYFNRPMAQRYILDLQMYRSVRDALLALRDGRCIGYLYSEMAIQQYLKEAEWQDYHAPLPAALVIPWGIYISRAEGGTEFEQLVSDIVAQWHRDGLLIELEAFWGIRPSQFLQETRETWLKTDDSGEYICRREDTGQWPVECRNPAFITSADVEGVRGFGLWIKENLGLNLTFIYDPFDSDRYWRGLLNTMALALFSILASLVLGYLGAKLVLSRAKIIASFFYAIWMYGRMTPPLLQMYILFFGVGSYLWATHEISVSPLMVAIAALGFYHGSIIVFTLVESARHARETYPDFRLTLRTLPQLLQTSIVGIRSALVNLTKATTIASAIAVPELLSATIAIMADHGNVMVMMNTMLIVFYFLSLFWVTTIMRIERWVLRLSSPSK